MAVNAYALTTRQRLIDFLGLTSSALTTTQENILDRIINSVTDYIEKRIGRRIKKTTYTNEVYDGDGSGVLQLRQYPIVSISAIDFRSSALNEDSWDSVDAESYYAVNNAGIVKGMGGYKFVKGTGAYRVSYIAGYDYDNSTTFLSDVGAADLEYACWKLCASAWNKKKGSQNVQSESLGDYSVTFNKTASEDQEITDILDSYGGFSVGGTLTPLNY